MKYQIFSKRCIHAFNINILLLPVSAKLSTSYSTVSLYFYPSQCPHSLVLIFSMYLLVVLCLIFCYFFISLFTSLLNLVGSLSELSLKQIWQGLVVMQLSFMHTVTLFKTHKERFFSRFCCYKTCILCGQIYTYEVCFPCKTPQHLFPFLPYFSSFLFLFTLFP